MRICKPQKTNDMIKTQESDYEAPQLRLGVRLLQVVICGSDSGYSVPELIEDEDPFDWGDEE